MGVGVAGGVEPVAAAVFAVVGGIEEFADEFFVIVRGLVSDEGGDVFGGRGEAGEVEGETACEGGAIGFLVGLEADFLEFGEDEGVDGVADRLGGGGGLWGCGGAAR